MASVRDTISDTLSILRFNLERGLDGLSPLPTSTDDDQVVIGNIALRTGDETPTPAIDDRIVITLVKTEEEFSLKNQPNHRRHPVTGNLEMVNPPIFLNLYLLITPNVDDYGTALTFLSRVISYFQYKRVFDENNLEDIPVGSDFTTPLQHYHFSLQMLSPSFEQLNHLWGVAGGKMLPSVLYKLQIQRIEYVPEVVTPGNPITEIVLNEQLF
ncbi:MAG: DUF4255 domain-containing protein [Bacteroidota bacterium]